MIISLNWLKKYTAIEMPIEELATLIGERLVEIEHIIPLGEKYKDVVVAKVVECRVLEGSDHLHVTKIDDGGVVSFAERDENGLVQVVCGAPNVREGLLVAWLPPQSTVPETFDNPEPFVLGSRPLRGVVSHGMLASAKELDLFDDHEGILEIDLEVHPGASFADAYELNDYLLDIENKSLTHRPDTFGIIGFAREVAGIMGHKFQTPEWLMQTNPVVQREGLIETPRVKIEDSALSSRFQAIVLGGVSEAVRSPLMIQTYLARSGVRPINALVDVSNYLMLLTGQPTHAYDYDKLRAVCGSDFTLRVRLAREGETLTLLDGKTVDLDSSDIVIAAGDTAVGLAGVMGGLATATDATTKTVLLEAATFDLYHMRSSQMRHGIFSEAVTRFTKGVPSSLSAPVIAEASRLLADYTGATVVSDIIEDYPVQYEPQTVTVSEHRVNSVLGTMYSAEDISELLGNVGLATSFNQHEAKVTVPYWRKDISLPEDIIEEVGRLGGFDTINPVLPTRSFTAIRPSSLDNLRAHLRQRLVRAGANEVLTYSFVHGNLFEKVGQSADNAYKVVNSISPELQYYRQSLTPSLLSQVFANVKSGYDAFALFELNKVHEKAWGLTDEKVPVEQNRLALVVTNTKTSTASAYYDAKAMLEYTLQASGIALQFAPLSTDDTMSRPFEPKRGAVVSCVKTGTVLGVVGEYRTAVVKALKLPARTAGFEIFVDAVLNLSQGATPGYRPASRYPGTERDICFQVEATTPYGVIERSALEALRVQHPLLITAISPVDIYQAPGSSVKNVTIRVTVASYEKTMTGEDVSIVINSVIDAVSESTGGKVV